MSSTGIFRDSTYCEVSLAHSEKACSTNSSAPQFSSRGMCRISNCSNSSASSCTRLYGGRSSGWFTPYSSRPCFTIASVHPFSETSSNPWMRARYSVQWLVDSPMRSLRSSVQSSVSTMYPITEGLELFERVLSVELHDSGCCHLDTPPVLSRLLFA